MVLVLPVPKIFDGFLDKINAEIEKLSDYFLTRKIEYNYSFHKKNCRILSCRFFVFECAFLYLFARETNTA